MSATNIQHHTIIQGADKGSAIVALTWENYIYEAQRQLNNPHHYLPLGYSSLYRSNQTTIARILEDLSSLGHITDKQLEFLKGPDNPRPRILYLFPKIHKPPHTWTIPFQLPPCRPIISDIDSESYNVSAYIDSFLQPLATSHPAYVKDSYDFAHMIRTLQIPPNTLLVTADVESMYTNISHEQGIQALIKCLHRNPDRTGSHPPSNTLLN